MSRTILIGVNSDGPFRFEAGKPQRAELKTTGGHLITGEVMLKGGKKPHPALIQVNRRYEIVAAQVFTKFGMMDLTDSWVRDNATPWGFGPSAAKEWSWRLYRQRAFQPRKGGSCPRPHEDYMPVAKTGTC